MKVGTALEIAADVINVLVSMGLIDASGDFVTPTAQQDAILAAKIEQVVKAHGVIIPAQIDAIIALLPLIFQIFGIK